MRKALVRAMHYTVNNKAFVGVMSEKNKGKGKKRGEDSVEAKVSKRN